MAFRKTINIRVTSKYESSAALQLEFNHDICIRILRVTVYVNGVGNSERALFQLARFSSLGSRAPPPKRAAPLCHMSASTPTFTSEIFISIRNVVTNSSAEARLETRRCALSDILSWVGETSVTIARFLIETHAKHEFRKMRIALV